MNDRSRSRGRWIRYAGALGALTALLFALFPAQAGNADNGLPAPGWSAQPTSPTTNLTDGQRVVINVQSNSDISVSEIEVRECRFGVTYSSDADVSPNAGNCPPLPVSTSADYLVVRGASDGLTALAKLSEGASVPFFVGEGVVDWTTTKKNALTCDPTHPCALVLELDIVTPSGGSTVFDALKLTFTDSDPISACGGFAKNALTTAGSDEISDAWAQWTRAECVKTGTGAPTEVSFPGEGPSVTSFVDGEEDLVYTAAGYDRTVGLAPAGAASLRPAVAVPIALNASVFAAGGGQHQLVDGQAIGDKVRYPDGSLEFTAAEVGATLGGGQPWISRADKPYETDILSRNPALQDILYAPDNGVWAPSESLASSWFMTDYLSAVAPADFVDPTVAPAAPYGPSASLALSQPAYDQINLYTGRPSLAKITVPAETTATNGPIWTMTDLASARALDLTPVALQSGSGFVAPTAASMDAAVAAMQPDSDGMLLPSPALATTTVPAGAVQPYPLTYVLYALVPAQPLFDPNTCVVRTGSQALLTSWLDYLTGAGQQNLPAGMEPLPPALLAKAQTAIKSVGAQKITGKCAPKAPPGSTTTTTTGPGKGGTGTGGSAPGGVLGPSPDDGVVLPPIVPIPSVSVPTSVTTTSLPGKIGKSGPVRVAEAAVKIPGFAGHRVVGAFDGAIALIGIALLMSFAVWLTARGGSLRVGVDRGSGLVSALTPIRVAALVLVWVCVSAVGLGLVLFQLGPTIQQREQRSLLAHYRVTVSDSANELQGLPGESAPSTAPEPGSPVGIIEIGALKSQDVVVEGVGASQTQQGPGHVPGTAGLGQPGNSVVVARHHGYGGAFAHIAKLHKGDGIVVTTTQGQSLYDVATVRDVKLVGSSDATLASATSNTTAQLTSASPSPASTTLDTLYGPTTDDRLTLVTSSSRAPWDTSRATEVVAELVGTPFVPTPQGARTAAETGTQGDRGAWPSVVLAVLAFLFVAAGSVVLYTKQRLRTAYILTSAPLVAITVIAAETLVRLLPAWT